MHPIREYIEYILARGFFALLRYSPACITYSACHGMSFLFYALLPSRRRITYKNLQIVFSEKSLREHKQIARAAYKNFGRFIAESMMIMAGKIKKEDILAMVDGSDMQKLLALEKSTDKGVLCITGHLGNFELLAHYTGITADNPIHIIAREGTNRLIDERIITPLRESFGNRVIYKNRAASRIVKALQQGNNVGILIDIKSNARQGAPVTFCGQETYAVKTPAFIQLKLGVPVISAAMIMISPKRYKVIAGEQIHWTDNGKTNEEQIAELTQIHQSAIEDLIRQYPEQWFWMHDRWKK